MTIKSSILSGLVLSAIAACSPSSTATLPTPAAELRPSPALGAAQGGGERDPRPRVLITAPLHNATNLGADLRITTIISCRHGGQCATDPAKTRQLVAGKIKLRDASGRVISVAPQAVAAPAVDPAKGESPVVPAKQYEATFVPAGRLAADQSYTIEVTSDADAVVGFASSPIAEEAAAAATTGARRTAHTAKIATSSDPLPTRIEVSADPKKAVRSVRVVFTEPVALATLAKGGLTITAEDGTTIEACAWSALQSACATESSPDLSSIVDFVFLSEVSPKALDSASLSVSTIVGGEGETVAEAAQRRGVTAASGVDGDRVLFDLRDGVWESCSASGDVRCIRNLKAR